MEMEPQNPPPEKESPIDSKSESTKPKKASKPRKSSKQSPLTQDQQVGQSEGGIAADQSRTQLSENLSKNSQHSEEPIQEKPKRKRSKKGDAEGGVESDLSSGSESASLGNEQSPNVESNDSLVSVQKEKKPRKSKKSTGETGLETGLEQVGGSESNIGEKKPRKSKKSSSKSEKTLEDKTAMDEKERKEREEQERMRSDSFDVTELRITRFPNYLLDRMDKKARNILTYSLSKLNSMNMKELGVCIDELNANKSFYDPQYSAEKDLYFHIIKLIKYMEKRLKEEEEKNAQKFFRSEFFDPYHKGKFEKIIKKFNNDPANSAWEIVEKMGRKVRDFPFNEGVLRKWIAEFLREHLQK